MVKVQADNSGTPGTVIAQYTYDGGDRRIEKTVAGATSDVHYYYDRQWQVVEERSVDAQGVTVANNQYVWSARYIDSPIVRFHDGNGDGDLLDAGDNIRYYTTDGNNNVTATIDAATGDVVERYVYTAYGKATVYAPTWTSPTAPITDGPLYCGYWFDAETGLNQVRNRYYDSGLSTFINRDPIGYWGGMNLYEYCGNSPLDYVDPLGLKYEGYWTNVGHTAKGFFWDGPVGIVSGIYTTVRHPVDTVVGLGTAVWHPIDTAVAIKDDIVAKAQMSEGQGQIGFDVATALVPAGLAAKAKYATEAADAARITAATRAARLAEEANQTAKAAEFMRAGESVTSCPVSTPVSKPSNYWRDRYAHRASEANAFWNSGKPVFPTLKNSGLKGSALRAEQKEFFKRGLQEGKSAGELRGQTAQSGYERRGGINNVGGPDRLAEAGAERMLQEALKELGLN